MLELLDAALAELLALFAKLLELLAELDELDAALVDADASTIKPHLAESVFVVSGWLPVDVCAVKQIYILLVVVSLTRSRLLYAVPAAQLPR